MKCDLISSNTMMMMMTQQQQQQRCYQEKKQIRKELFKWSKQATEYCAFDAFLEYLLPNDRFKLVNKKYKDFCDKLKQEEVFDFHESMMDEEEEFNDNKQEQQAAHECYDDVYDDGYKENQLLDDEPLDLSKKEQQQQQHYDPFAITLAALQQQFAMTPYDQQQSLKLFYETSGFFNNDPSANIFMKKMFQQQQQQLPPQKVVAPPVVVPATPASSTRRNYTKEELDKALADIQSGRIGTRRASVLYGIPRSTLRNKVFRLNNQKNSATAAAAAPPPPIKKAPLQQSETKFDQLKDKLISNLSINFAYDKLSTLGHEQNDDLVIQEYAKVVEHTNTQIQQYLNNAMMRILNDIVCEKIAAPAVAAAVPPIIEPSSIKTIKSNSNEQIKLNHHRREQQQQQQLSLKQKRAKRGQYRKYESDQLAKAVDAVINGLMSVHKAGSHFGVPHSTLEYKVKERNTNKATAVVTAASSPPSKNKTVEKKKQDSENQNNKNLFLYPPPNSTSPPPPPSYSASELLRKLYEGVNSSQGTY